MVKPLTAISSVLLHLGFLSPGFGQDIENLKKGVVKITAEVEGKRKLGTGFIVQKEEDAIYIVTASHVVEGARQIQVEFFTHVHRTFSAKVLGIEGGDPQGLAALLVVDKAPPGLVALPLGNIDDLSGGEPATTIGFPRVTGVAWAVIKGSIMGRKGQYIDVSMPLDEGNSGGPLIVEGQVIGIVTAVIGQYGRAVPAIIARYILDGWGIKVPPAPKPRVGTLVVEGVASIQPNEDITSARNRAIVDALRHAVERALGIYIEEEALIEDFSRLEVIIYKKTKGHVVTYEVIEGSERRDGNIYELELRAVVCLEPRILVIVPEVHGDREVQDPTAETAIINGLLKAGFPVVGKYELSNVRKGASAKRALKGDRKAALDLALQYGANVVIVGEGASEPAGTISGLHSVRAWLYARAFKTDEDIIVGAHSLQVSGLGITENAASREAFSLGGARMADYLVERLAEFRHPDAIKTIRLVINNLRSKSQFDELKQAITNMLLVIDAKVNLLEQDKAELIIKSLGGAQDLVEDLSNLGFIDLAIAKTHEHEIQVTVE